MTTYVALLRGVNVGKAKRVPMADLRKLLAALGYTDIATLLNSGNAVFCAKKDTPRQLAADIAGAIARRLKFEVPVIVKSAPDISAIVSGNPFEVQDSEHSRFLVAFTQEPGALAGLSAIEPLIEPPEQFAVGRHAAYLYCAAGILKSKAGEALLGRIGRNATTRNLATTLKLNKLASGQ